VSGETSLTLVD